MSSGGTRSTSASGTRISIVALPTSRLGDRRASPKLRNHASGGGKASRYESLTPPLPRAGEQLASLLEALRHAGRLPATLRESASPRDDFAALAADAATQWTGTFNPRPFDAAAALELYQRAY